MTHVWLESNTVRGKESVGKLVSYVRYPTEFGAQVAANFLANLLWSLVSKGLINCTLSVFRFGAASCSWGFFHCAKPVLWHLLTLGWPAASILPSPTVLFRAFCRNTLLSLFYNSADSVSE